ncbi:MAG: nicotinate-nucleotide diphosphorylase, partial [Gammaproteobacteria bacterium]|nr:nicotinate-nucleotide diphosphorylase [Gammaproteobacteria bacterium]
MISPSADDIKIQVQQALKEDMGSGDVTAALIPAEKSATAQLICREKAILCGCNWFEMAFMVLNPEIQVQWFFKESQQINENDIVCEIKGNARHILTAERTALNFLQTLSATASQTFLYANAIKETTCKILDTRKTIP